MNEQLVKSLYKSIVLENMELYKNLFSSTEVGPKTTEYWKNAMDLYNTFSGNDKETFMSIIEQTIVDTISNILGIVDGSSTLSDFDSELKLVIDDYESDGELQDKFLELIENLVK